MKARVASVALCLTLGCGPGGGDPAEETWLADTLAGIETMVGLEEGLGLPVDLAVAPDGITLHILDYARHEILTVAPDGSVHALAGGEGSGPGEFRGPVAFALSEDTLRVVDAGNGRIQVLTPDGIYARSYPLPIPLGGSGASITTDGVTVLPTGGFADTSLVVVYDSEGALLRRVGKLPGRSFEAINLTAIKKTIAAGEIPDAIRNFGLPALAQDGDLWIALPGEGEVRRYDGQGRLRWSRKLELPVFADMRAEFIKRNAEEERPFVFHTLRYFVDLEIVADDIWLLLGTPPGLPGRIAVIDGEGSLVREIVLPGVEEPNNFAVDPEGGVVYLTVSGEPVILAGAVGSRQ